MMALLGIALGLSMDAFAVSVSSGMSIRDLKPLYAIRASFFFGLFQFLMPVAGWYLGSAFARYTEAYAHWIAFGLLAFIGGKMIAGALGPKEKSASGDTVSGGDSVSEGDNTASSDSSASGDIRSFRTLLALSVATSIDALAAGISLHITGHTVQNSAAIIGGVTFFVCLSGFEAGRRAGRAMGKWAELTGGILLAAIGVNIVIQHCWGR